MSELVEILTENRAVKGLIYPIEIKVYRDGVQIVPSSVTITVKNPDGTAQVEDVSMTITANIGTLTYTLDSAYTGTLWENAWMEVSYTDENSVTQKQIFYFDVVNNLLGVAVITANLQKLHPQLLDEIWSDQIPANYSPQIQAARMRVDRDLIDRDYRPDLLVDNAQTVVLVETKTMELICKDFFKQIDDRWHMLYMEYKEEYKSRLTTFKFTYDADGDTTVDEGEKKAFGQINLLR